MDPAIDDLGIDVPEISHVGVVVRDLEAAMENYGRILGLREWQRYTFGPPAWQDARYRGEETGYTMQAAFADTGQRGGAREDGSTPGPDRVELIEPLSGESDYTDFLAEHGPGLHHVGCFAFEDPDDVVETFLENGIEVLQYGNYGGMEIFYFDTRELLDGVVFETATNLDANPGPDSTYTVGG